MKHRKIIMAAMLAFVIALMIPLCKSYDKMLFLRVELIGDVYIPKRIADEYVKNGIIDPDGEWTFMLSEQELEKFIADTKKENNPWKETENGKYQCIYDLTNEKFINIAASSKTYKWIELNVDTENAEYTAVLERMN
ncbi:MAG: hypothetical protein NC110_05410 [Ruminococcus sp.]|nr:hypothetical protein [Ruminococcus sp.]